MNINFKKTSWVFGALLLVGVYAKNAQAVCSTGTFTTVSLAYKGATSNYAFSAGLYNEVATMTFVNGTTPLTAGTTIAMRIPDFWNPPYEAFGSNIYSGGVRYSTSTSGPAFTASLTMSTSGQFVLIAINSGSIVSGHTLRIHYGVGTCNLGPAIFRAFFQDVGCTMAPIATFPGTVAAGPPSFINFDTYNLIPLVNTIIPLKAYLRDNCNNNVTAAAPVNFDLTALEDVGSGYVTDTDAQMSLDSGFTSPTSILNTNIPANGQAATFYYRISSFNPAPGNYYALRMNYNLQGFNSQNWITVQPVTTGITGASVDTGTVGTLTSVTITPNNDAVNDFAYINFTLPNDFGWEVGFSTDNFASFSRRYFGWGRGSRVSWDGFIDVGQGGAIGPAGTYKVRISAGGGSLKDETLQVVLDVVSLRGTIRESGSLTPLADADVSLFGPTQRYARTDSNGNFMINGLQPGYYNGRVNKPGYGFKEFNANVTSGIYDAGNIDLDKTSVLHLGAVRPNAAFLPEVWGNATVRTNNWSSSFYGNIHFAQGSTTSDAGDTYNATVTTYTLISVLPGVEYFVEINGLPGYGIDYSVDTTTFVVAAGAIAYKTVQLTRRANISGEVRLPANSQFGTWVSVEGGIDSNMDGTFDSSSPTGRVYGGAFINAGSSVAIYNLTGVTNGIYLLKAQTQGFARTQIHVTVAGGADVSNAHFPAFSIGGTISGNITINGNTTVLDYDNDGFFQFSVNAWSPTTYEGSWTQITMPTGLNPTTTSYSLTGLSNGTYELQMWLNGFEASPPGPKFVTVAGSPGSGAQDLTFNQYSGAITGLVTLKNGAGDFNNVVLELKSLRSFGGITTSTTSPDITTGIYQFTGLGTDFYSLRAKYLTNGFVAEYGVQVVNGSTTTRNVDLTGDTYSIAGRVTSSASSPYNDLAYIVSYTTPTTLYGSNGSQAILKANTIMAKKNVKNQPNDPNSAMNYLDPALLYFGEYDSATGSYLIDKLSPGTYELFNNGEMDGNTGNGGEIAVEKRFVNVIAANITGEDFTLTDGFTVSGQLKVESGESETGRTIRLTLRNNKGDSVSSELIYLTGTSANFTLRRVPAGSYVLSGEDNQPPAKYSIKDLSVDVSANVTNREIKLLKAAKIQGQLRVKTTGTLISSNNSSQILPTNFFIEARSNPWFPGGYGRASYPLIGSNNLFTVTANPGTYDIILKSEGFIGDSAVSEGKKQFVPVTISGIKIEAGQTKDLGVIDLVEGIRVTGTITNKNGVPLPNLAVEANPTGSRGHDDSAIRAYTNQEGKYTLYGIDSEKTRYYEICAAPRPDSRDQRYSTDLIVYGEVCKAQLDTQTTTQADFQLELAQASVTGTITTSDNGQLILPFEEDEEAGAYIIMNKQGNVPQDNPLGDIEATSNAAGIFQVKGLTPGSYDLWVIAKGYGSASRRNIVVGTGATDVGTIQLSTGYKLFGTLRKPDGSSPSANDIDVMLGVRNGFEEILVGSFVEDASGNVNKYEISGFQASRTYSVVLMYEDGDVNVLASGVSLTADTEQNFVITDSTPTVLTQLSRNSQTGVLTVQFELSRSLRNSDVDLDDNEEPDDSEQDKLISLITGGGTLAFPDNWFSSDRKRIIVNYTPAAGEEKFTLRFAGTFVSEDSSTGLNHTLTQNFEFFTGIGQQITVNVANANGGDVEFPSNDTSSFSPQAGTFGSDVSKKVAITMKAAEDQSGIASQNPAVSRVGFGAMAHARASGYVGYPSEMKGAILRAADSEINPFSSFYDIFLPAGVSHFFPQGKAARLCLQYDDSAPGTDPYSLNIYYFNPQTDEYMLESENKAVDEENKTICANILHASVFTVLNSTVSILQGGGYTGELAVINFPNPFNLKSKAITLQDPGTNSAAQTIDGTMIKVSVPTTINGSIKIEIFNVVGELVRTLNLDNASGGSHYYIHWNGRNDSGEEVASGAYIGRMTIGDANEKFFKMAVIK